MGNKTGILRMLSDVVAAVFSTLFTAKSAQFNGKLTASP